LKFGDRHLQGLAGLLAADPMHDQERDSIAGSIGCMLCCH
jgi:hypothetical protein